MKQSIYLRDEYNTIGKGDIMKTKTKVTRNFLGVMICLALLVGVLSGVSITANAAETYDVWVGGVQVTDDTADDVFGDGTVSYNTDTKTLTLNGYTYEGTGYEYYSQDGESYTAVIYSVESITVELLGNSLLVNTYTDESQFKYGDGIISEGSITVAGNGNLNISGDYGINSYEDVVIGGGTVEINSTGDSITVDGDVEIRDANVILDAEMNGIYAGGSVKITDSVVSINAAGDGIYAYDGNVEIDCTEVTTNANFPGLVGTKVSVKSDQDYGIFAYKDLVMNERLTISTPDEGEISELTENGGGFDPYTYNTIVDSDGNIAKEVVIEPLGYDVKIEGVDFELSITVPAGQSIAEAYGADFTGYLDPTKEGYTFGGWYTDENCTEGNEFSFDMVINADVTVYAKWVEDKPADETPVPDPTEEPINTPKPGNQNNQKVENPETDDSSNMLLWFILLVAGGSCFFVMNFNRKKDRTEEN